jgi:hypothetical protein
MDGAIEKSAMRKVYMRLLPFAILSYFLAYIDRINVSFAGLTMRGVNIGLARSRTLATRTSRDVRARHNQGADNAFLAVDDMAALQAAVARLVQATADTGRDCGAPSCTWGCPADALLRAVPFSARGSRAPPHRR